MFRFLNLALLQFKLRKVPEKVDKYSLLTSYWLVILNFIPKQLLIVRLNQSLHGKPLSDWVLLSLFGKVEG